MHVILFTGMGILLALAAPAGSIAKDSETPTAQPGSTAADSTRIIVRVERTETPIGKYLDTLDVTVQIAGMQLGGFDFKIASADPYLDIIAVLPGELLDSCKWDYFTARPVDRTDRPGYPPVLWHALGMAEGIPDTAAATCFGLDRPASIVRLVVSNEHAIQMADTSVALFFLWEDCLDNVVANVTGEKLYMSTNVLDYLPTPQIDNPLGFPTRTGAPKQCYRPEAPNPIQRKIEFHNGGVKFSIPTDLWLPRDTVAKSADSLPPTMPTAVDSTGL